MQGYTSCVITIINIIFMYSLCISPFFNLLSMVNSKYLYNYGLILSFRDKVYIFFWILLLLAPIMFLEIIHFFPLFFAYYIDHSIKNRNEFIIILIIFNVPKCIFLFHIIPMFIKTRNELQTEFEKSGHLNIYQSKAPNKNNGVYLIFIILLFITLPLIPYMYVMISNGLKENDNENDNKIYDKQNLKNKKKANWFSYYCITNVYTWLSYIGSNAVLYWLVHEKHNQSLSIPVQYATYVVVGCCLFITITMPFTANKVKKLIPFGIVLQLYNTTTKTVFDQIGKM